MRAAADNFTGPGAAIPPRLERDNLRFVTAGDGRKSAPVPGPGSPVIA